MSMHRLKPLKTRLTLQQQRRRHKRILNRLLLNPMKTLESIGKD